MTNTSRENSFQSVEKKDLSREDVQRETLDKHYRESSAAKNFGLNSRNAGSFRDFMQAKLLDVSSLRDELGQDLHAAFGNYNRQDLEWYRANEESDLVRSLSDLVTGNPILSPEQKSVVFRMIKRNVQVKVLAGDSRDFQGISRELVPKDPLLLPKYTLSIQADQLLFQLATYLNSLPDSPVDQLLSQTREGATQIIR